MIGEKSSGVFGLSVGEASRMKKEKKKRDRSGDDRHEDEDDVHAAIYTPCDSNHIISPFSGTL